MQTNIDGSFESLIAQAVKASTDDQSELAISLLQQAASANPGSGAPHFLLGSEYAHLQRFDEAEASLANAVLLSPELWIARYQLGLLQFSSGRAAIALVTWQPLLSLPESDALGHFVRGFAALAQDDLEGAVRHYNAGLALNPANPALCADIHRLLQGIEDVRDKPGASGSHVLLGGYSGGLH